ncbi:MAG: serine/threonine protein kinase [Acidobacteria bacterium]|nr:serine/threonine protein kinase [Acidobacteriota bacterium]
MGTTTGGERTGQATDSFVALTPERVLEAVEAAGLRCNAVCYPLNSFENRVYEVELVDRSRIIAKFYRPGRWTEPQILEEHRFITELVQAEIPACPVRTFPDGSTLKRQEGIFYSLAERRGGRAPDELTDELAERLGMLVGRMHAVAAAEDAPHRLSLDADTYVRGSLEWLEAHRVLPAAFESRYRRAAEGIAEVADRLMAGVERQRLHGDLHLGNLLLRDGRFNVLDFDDMVTGPAVQDLWLALPGRDADTRRQRELFLEGYERFRLFDRSTLPLIEPLRGLRLVHFATWLARRWHDPIFPATWPHFGTEDYWRQETEALEEVLDLIDRANAPAGRVLPDEPELTNKDFFWDWED